MGEVISSGADVARIDEHIHAAYDNAMARGGDIAAAAVDRLGPAITAIDGALRRRGRGAPVRRRERDSRRR